MLFFGIGWKPAKGSQKEAFDNFHRLGLEVEQLPEIAGRGAELAIDRVGADPKKTLAQA